MKNNILQYYCFHSSFNQISAALVSIKDFFSKTFERYCVHVLNIVCVKVKIHKNTSVFQFDIYPL